LDKINHPHDKFFKKMFGEIVIAKDFLQNYLPDEILKITDLSNVTHEKESFIEKDMEEYYSDLLFRTNINGKDSYIYFLIEHKSYIDRVVAIQILEYIVKIWKLKAKKNKVPLVIPMLVYHGEKEWKVDKNLLSLLEGVKTLPKDILRYVPSYEYLVYDLSSFTDDEIKGEAVVQIIIRLFINIFRNKGDIKSIVTEAGNALEELFDKNKGSEYFEVFIRYIMAVKDMDIEDIISEDDQNGRSDLIMALADKLRNEGIEQGIKKGIEQTAIELKKNGSDIKFISKVTKIPVKELEELFKKINNNL
jgi:predicted transposase/invertase (TIGR01784 family)